jgi:site-specific DNA-cytosine methylase
MVAACRNPATEALYTKGYSGGQRDACTQEADAGKALRVLRQEVGEEDFAQWGLGILDSFQCKEVLRSGLLGQGDGEEKEVSESEAGREVVSGSSKGKKHLPERRLSEVRQAGRERRTSQGWKLSQQLSRELGAYLQKLPLEGAPKEETVLDLWKASGGLRVLRDALPEVQEMGRSTSCERQSVHSGSQGYRSEQEEGVRGSWVRSVGACEGPLRSPLDAEEARDARITAEDEKRDSQRNVGQSPLCVRRLVPSECEFLQGFPAGHTAITFRKKPAADGPRYRALGNSMAVPCMVWLGHRIQQATKGDNT